MTTYNITGMIPITGGWAFTATIESNKELTKEDIEAMSIKDIMALDNYYVSNEHVGLDPNATHAFIHDIEEE